MYIESVKNRNSPPCVLLRESWREDGKVRKRTILNLTKWPAPLVTGLRELLRGGVAVRDVADSFEILRSRPHGHVAATLGSLRQLKLDSLLDPQPSRYRDLACALIVARILQPRSKLATARALDPETLGSSLGSDLGLGGVSDDDLYRAMDWLLARQPAIETALARRHLAAGDFVLADVSSSYFEGRRCSLAARGHSRDGKKGKLQIVFGLLCNRAGCPVAVQVFAGNTADPRTVGPQINTLRQNFGLERVVLVGDRGLLTEARLRADLEPLGLDWITALRNPAIRLLAEAKEVQLSLFDERDLVEITSAQYPDERLLLCRNPDLARERARKREELLQATEARLAAIATAVRRKRNPLRGAAKIGLRVGKAVQKYKMAKHFELTIRGRSFRYVRKTEAIAAEAALDGLYVIRTSLAQEELAADEAVRAYKGLGRVERAFRSFKTVDLKVRPIYHWNAERVRAHVLLCMLAYYVEWHMREKLAPLLFAEEDPAAAEAQRDSPVAPAQPSPAAREKASTQRTTDGRTAHSFRTLLDDLATITRNRIQPKLDPAQPFEMLTRPTALQKRAFELLGVKLECTQ